MFYNYVYLDPRKPGEYVYEDLKFDFEPFYVGKGKEFRYLEHLKSDSRNLFRTNKIKKIVSLGYDMKQFIVLLNEGVTEQEAFEHEITLIQKIGRIISDEGPLTNFSPGGYGGDTMTHHPNRDEIIERNKRVGVAHKFYKKKYSEIYGEDSEKEKKKREHTYFKVGRKVDQVIINKQKETRKINAKPAWNKGLTGVQVSWNKGKTFTTFSYTLTNLLTNEFFIAVGFQELNEVIKKVNKNLPWKDRIKKCELLKGIYKNFKLDKKNERNERNN